MADIEALPYPASGDLELSPNEQIVADDIIDYYRDFVRLGEKSAMLGACDDAALTRFCEVYVRQVEAVYRGLRALPAYRWPGAICQPFVFGAGEVDWSGGFASTVGSISILAVLASGFSEYREAMGGAKKPLT